MQNILNGCEVTYDSLTKFFQPVKIVILYVNVWDYNFFEKVYLWTSYLWAIARRDAASSKTQIFSTSSVYINLEKVFITLRVSIFYCSKQTWQTFPKCVAQNPWFLESHFDFHLLAVQTFLQKLQTCVNTTKWMNADALILWYGVNQVYDGFLWSVVNVFPNKNTRCFTL